jgi:hypothetical protein
MHPLKNPEIVPRKSYIVKSVSKELEGDALGDGK